MGLQSYKKFCNVVTTFLIKFLLKAQFFVCLEATKKRELNHARIEGRRKTQEISNSCSPRYAGKATMPS